MYKITWGKRAFRIFVRQWRWEGDNVGNKQRRLCVRMWQMPFFVFNKCLPLVDCIQLVEIKHIESYKHIPRVLYSTGIMNMKSILSDS